MAWATLCRLDELTENEGFYAEIDGFELAVYLTAGQVHVTDNECPHAGGSMASGHVEDGCAICPWHGWAFDLKDGSLRGSLAGGDMLRTYVTRLHEANGVTFVQAELPMP